MERNEALTALNLHRNVVGAEGAAALAEAMQPQRNPDGTWTQCATLEVLDLRANAIGPEGAERIAGAVAPRQNPDKSWVRGAALGRA